MSEQKGISTPIDTFTQNRVASGYSAQNYKVSSVKTDAWFSPMQPLAPIAQEKAHGRQFDFATGYNLRIRPKDDAPVSYVELRALADNLDVLRLVIETRKDQIESFDWDIIAKEGRKVPDSVINAIKDKMQNPTHEYSWASWLRMILEELFVIDAVAVLPRFTRGGDVYSLDLIDGATIKRVIDEQGRTPMSPDPAYQQILKGVPATDYTADELMFMMRNPRVHKLYGFSPVEQIIMTINIALRRQLTQLQYYTEGNVPEAMAGVPESWNPDQIRQFQMYFDSMLVDNTAEKSRLKFLPLDATKIKEMRDPNLKDQFDEWLARVVCYAFSVPATPFVAQVNRATAETSASSAESEGLAPTLSFVKRMVDKLLSNYFQNSDIEFKWKQKTAIKPIDQANIDKIHVDSGIRTVNEIRADNGWDELDEKVVEPVKPEVKPDPVVAVKSTEVEDLIKVISAEREGNAEIISGLAKIAAREIPAPIVNVDNSHHPVEIREIKKEVRNVTAKRMPDGTLQAVFE